MRTLLVNTAYFPPIQYFGKIKQHQTVVIEKFEHYDKQSYRNRCMILTANGVIPLNVPVKNSALKFFTKDAEIDYSTNWQKIHFKAIESAYKNSPFYDYYIDDYMGFFENKEKFLLEYNTKILHTLLSHIGLKREVAYTTDYVREADEYCDMRNVIHPKRSKRPREDDEFTPIPYQQTFCDRFPFTPNLSILDLLFNTGPETAVLL